ncbi:nucleotidyltransferase family protein [Sporomusa sp. KB1]|jgi:predicted nucleotidyltransferase|uniref:nucleotidyltransferase family protein n=1 Tax=Sporomusa sp. KB1 TaxID=943346 RepID=UPI00119EC0F0|nr:nucleotidyltransferase domain-containing protein [Sporomusa sp. KB1]TWH49262.1 putative nucleotidyltransferase [Sporomusa sp. KB1]
MAIPINCSLPQELLNELIYRIQAKLDSHIEKIILYGSCARGEAQEDSDIDIMALIRTDGHDLKKFREDLVDIAFDLSLKHDLDISILSQDLEEYKKWSPYIPFFQNVRNESIVLYERTNHFVEFPNTKLQNELATTMDDIISVNKEALLELAK